jgi:hypothetical protein
LFTVPELPARSRTAEPSRAPILYFLNHPSSQQRGVSFIDSLDANVNRVLLVEGREAAKPGRAKVAKGQPQSRE